MGSCLWLESYQYWKQRDGIQSVISVYWSSQEFKLRTPWLENIKPKPCSLFLSLWVWGSPWTRIIGITMNSGPDFACCVTGEVAASLWGKDHQEQVKGCVINDLVICIGRGITVWHTCTSPGSTEYSLGNPSWGLCRNPYILPVLLCSAMYKCEFYYLITKKELYL